MRFKPGQKVVCTVYASGWIKGIDITKLSFWERLKLIYKGNKAIGPDYNQIVTVINVKCSEGQVAFKEYDFNIFGSYEERCFEPLVSDAVLFAELESCLDPNVKQCD